MKSIARVQLVLTERAATVYGPKQANGTGLWQLIRPEATPS